MDVTSELPPIRTIDEAVAAWVGHMQGGWFLDSTEGFAAPFGGDVEATLERARQVLALPASGD